MNRFAQLVYTARTATTGGRENGDARSADGVLDVRLSAPGSARIGTNPEQLIAAAWSASLASAIAEVARDRRIPLPAKVRIEARLSLNLGASGQYLSAELDIAVPGLAQDVVRALADEAQAICPCTRAMRGNVLLVTRAV